jgi:vacuolar iron transporter family protein
MTFLTQRGFSFGLTSGIITTLGLMVGLYSSTHSEMAILGGILTIAIADAFSDSLSMHISEEAQNNKTAKEIWRSTFLTFVAKFIFALIFIIPFLFFSIDYAVTINILYAFVIIISFNYLVAKKEKKKPLSIITEHLMITVLVIIATYFTGKFINGFFN